VERSAASASAARAEASVANRFSFFEARRGFVARPPIVVVA
jgi:hypothetical protein